MASTPVPDVDWQISDAGKSEIGNDANRFDQWRQGDAPIGPEPEVPAMGPPETDGR